MQMIKTNFWTRLSFLHLLSAFRPERRIRVCVCTFFFERVCVGSFHRNTAQARLGSVPQVRTAHTLSQLKYIAIQIYILALIQMQMTNRYGNMVKRTAARARRSARFILVPLYAPSLCPKKRKPARASFYCRLRCVFYRASIAGCVRSTRCEPAPM